MPHKRTMPRVCRHCGTDFLVEANRPGRGKYCSPACGYAARTKPRIDRTCEWCSAGFLAEQFQVDLGGARFCSQACSIASRRVTEFEIGPDGSARIPMRSANGEIRGYVLVDAGDAAWATQWRWHLLAKGNNYAVRNSTPVDGKSHLIYMHRQLMGLCRDDDRTVDHINRDRQDNRRSNLRVIPRSGNAQNVGSLVGSTSAYRGVSWRKQQRKWVARVNVSGQDVYLGLFDSEIEAADAARAGRARLLPFAVD